MRSRTATSRGLRTAALGGLLGVALVFLVAAPAFAVSTGPTVGVASFPAKGFGASAVLTTGGTDGVAMASGLGGSNWVGYPTSAANFLTATGPTGNSADTLVVTNQVNVDYTVPAGSYSDTINYVVTPSY